MVRDDTAPVKARILTSTGEPYLLSLLCSACKKLDAGQGSISSWNPLGCRAIDFQRNSIGWMRQRARKLVLRRKRFKVGKPTQLRSLQKLEMCDLGSEFFEATLTVGNFGAEQILMVTIEGVAFQVFVGSATPPRRWTIRRSCRSAQVLAVAPMAPQCSSPLTAGRRRETQRCRRVPASSARCRAHHCGRLVDLRLQHRLHVPRLDTDHWQLGIGESTEEPL
jgi:hypothetical protein